MGLRAGDVLRGSVLYDLDRHAEIPLQAVHERRERTVALAAHRAVLTVDEQLHKVALTPAPVDQKMFGEETCHDHANTIVHKSCCIEFPNPCIDNRITSSSFTPGLKFTFVVSPFDLIVLRFECVVHLWKMPEDHHKKLPPDEFVEPGLIPHRCRRRELTHADGTKSQMHAHPAGAMDGRKIAGLVVSPDDRFIRLDRSNLIRYVLKTDFL